MSLTVKKLRPQLAALPGEAEDWPVVLAKDAEGNQYSPLDEVTPGHYLARTTWSGAFTDDGRRTVDNAVCLWPAT